MKPLESRISALERARDNILPSVRLTLPDGTQARMNALDAFLYWAQADAGKPGVEPYINYHIDGPLPTFGIVWGSLEKDLNKIPGRTDKEGE